MRSPKDVDSPQSHDDNHLAPPPPPESGEESGSSTPSRPSAHKFATERPQPSPRDFHLAHTQRAGSVGEKLPQLDRRVTFDPYSSDSSASSDDDEEDMDGRGEKSAGPASRIKINNEHFRTKGRISKKDGRLKLSINETMNSGYFAKTLGAGIRKTFKGVDSDGADKANQKGRKIAPEDDPMESPDTRIRLNIVVIVIGSRGDIQPFLRIGKILKEDYGHRVRIATHPAFKTFVEKDSGLEFFSIGGDPSELMAFMVKNPGLIPGIETVREGEIGRRRKAMMEMFGGMWRACVNAKDEEGNNENLKMMGHKVPFVCDAIIANPPSFAPPHIAERLGVPLHMMFTFPYSPTTQFPHPLANIKTSNVDAPYTNFMSYPLVEMMTWQGLGDLINRFRVKTLCLEEVSTLWAPGQLYRLKVPYTYMWSPGLVPKPKDWGNEIEISGFVFLDLASSFQPPDDLVKFLEAGPPPVYIGFGSIVVDDPDEFTRLIYKAVEIAGVRALVSKGWGGFGSKDNTPDNIFMLENTPHDWLFPKVSAVVHHGGAGTTAAALKCARPTMIVPFFGDQPFWGAMVSQAKAGAHECIPYKKLTAERLAEGIEQCMSDEAKTNVKKIADSIAAEGDGALNAVRSFHRSLPLQKDGIMRCSFLPNHAAAWRLKNTSIRLSPLAAELLVDWRKIKWNDLRLLRHYEWNDFGGPGEPVTGIWGAFVDTVSDVATGVGLVPVNMAKSVNKREKYYMRRWRVKKRDKMRDKQRRETLKKANKDLSNETPTNSPPQTTNETNQQKKPPRPNAPRRVSTTLSQITQPEDDLAEEFAHEATHGFHKTFSAIIKSPMSFSLALTQGFHNAPRLYGDETVRRPPRVTGFHSGLRAGRDELIYGVRDGVSGLWMQPYRGAKNHGILGFVRGVGYGVGGLVLKDIAAFFGPGAYFLKGLDEECRKKNQPTAFLRRSRIMQGHCEVGELEVGGRGVGGIERVGRKVVEQMVNRKWKELAPVIRSERRGSRNGVRAALLGRKTFKEGLRVPLKTVGDEEGSEGEEEGEGVELGKVGSAPIVGSGVEPLSGVDGRADKAGDGVGDDKEDGDGLVDGETNGMRKTFSAPGTAGQWNEKRGQWRWSRKLGFHGLDRVEREDVREGAGLERRVGGEVEG
ncbi:UDP-Glycosyltransferase/glycogen phosphorylase [Massarina eburnea CBS 473.64]|uniref:UDP-Glycosyltransferase/glycogen phosphorylase n=1 Tax=Massarina eburnea CBS 473.64 TaxID=1395130 RepID=A0A6A6RK89_9PLEO|nr:UDP-Glycosyltransferase/glycogen phosphorylase [Massarina eburnea CBS 473.64]